MPAAIRLSTFSLPDWAFYPIATAVAAGMVALALSFGDTVQRTPEEIRAEGLTYEGEALAAVITGNGLTASLMTEGSAPFLRLSAWRGPLDGIQSAGAFFALSEAELEALEGHRVRVTILARQADEQPAEGLRVTFFAPGIGQDSWSRHTIGGEFEEIEFDISPTGCDWGFGYIGLWPDWGEDANTVDVARAQLTALEPLEC